MSGSKLTGSPCRGVGVAPAASTRGRGIQRGKHSTGIAPQSLQRACGARGRARMPPARGREEAGLGGRAGLCEGQGSPQGPAVSPATTSASGGAAVTGYVGGNTWTWFTDLEEKYMRVLTEACWAGSHCNSPRVGSGAKAADWDASGPCCPVGWTLSPQLWGHSQPQCDPLPPPWGRPFPSTETFWVPPVCQVQV